MLSFLKTKYEALEEAVNRALPARMQSATFPLLAILALIAASGSLALSAMDRSPFEMTMLGTGIIMLVTGVVLLINAGDHAANATVELVAHLVRRVPFLARYRDAIIGVVMGLVTSLAEAVVNTVAGIKDQMELAVISTLGSDLGNPWFILPLAVLMLGSIAANKLKYERAEGVIQPWHGALLLAGMPSIVLAALLFNNGLVTPMMSIAIMVLSVATVVLFTAVKLPGQENEEVVFYPQVIARFVYGVAGIIIAADLALSGTVSIAMALGISAVVLGVLVIAMGTSLPELSLMAQGLRNGSLTLTVVAMSMLVSNGWDNLSLGATMYIFPTQLPANLAFISGSLGLLIVMLFMAWRLRQGGASGFREQARIIAVYLLVFVPIQIIAAVMSA